MRLYKIDRLLLPGINFEIIIWINCKFSALIRVKSFFVLLDSDSSLVFVFVSTFEIFSPNSIFSSRIFIWRRLAIFFPEKAFNYGCHFKVKILVLCDPISFQMITQWAIVTLQVKYRSSLRLTGLVLKEVNWRSLLSL